jgi:hypothetical protein
MDIFPLLHEKLTKRPKKFKILKVLQCAFHSSQSLSDDLLYYLSNRLTQNNKIICATILHKAMDNGQILSDDIVHTIEKSFLLNDTQIIMNLIRKLAKQYIYSSKKTLYSTYD